MFYLIVFGILAILSLMNLQFTDKLSRQMLMLPVVLMLIGIAGLRYETGGDWDVYTRLFLKFPDLESLRYNPLLIHNKHAEEGFILLCAIIKSLGGTIQTLFFVVTAFNITLIASVLPKYTKYPVLALLCYYCILYFNLEMIFIRQAIAVFLRLAVYQRPQTPAIHPAGTARLLFPPRGSRTAAVLVCAG